MRFYVLYIRCLFLDVNVAFCEKISNSVYAGTELGVPARAMAPPMLQNFLKEHLKYMYIGP